MSRESTSPNEAAPSDAVVVVVERPSGEILMIQRPNSDTYPLYWNPITGACELRDRSSLEETCRREAREEAGLEIEVVGKIYQSLTYRRHFNLHWFLARVVGDKAGLPPPVVRPDPSEVAGFAWVSVKQVELLKPSFADTHRFFAEEFATARARVLDSFGCR